MCKKKIVVTRPSSRTRDAVRIIEEHDGVAVVVPTLELELVNSSSLKDLINKLDSLDWLIFTSVSSLDSIFKFYPDFLNLLNDNCKTAVIGHKTAEVCEDYGLRVDLVPRDYTAEGLLESFEKISIDGLNIGIPRTFSARAVLPEGLRSMGANVFLAETYKSVLPSDTSLIKDLIAKIENCEVDAISFTSPLTVHNLFKVANNKKSLSESLNGDVLTVCIGPITYKALENYGVKCVYPKIYTVKDMLELLFDKIL